MEVTFYKCLEPKNKVDKVLENGVTVTGQMKTDCNIDSLQLTFNRDTEISFYNYCYIKELNRYYFIKDMTIDRNGSYTVKLEIDVLKTFADEIKKCYGKVKICASPYDNSFNPSIEARYTKQIYNFESPFINDGVYVMVAIAS